MLPLLDDRPHGLDGVVEDGGRFDECLPEVNLPPSDAGDVQQVVDEVGEGADLPGGDVLAPFEGLLGARAGGDGDGVLDGGERVPQLVGEHGEELVLATVGGGELGFIRLGPVS